MVIIIGATTLFVGSRSPNAIRLKRADDSLKSLQQAKEALLAYAITADSPGGLPCPDSDNDGEQNAAGNNCVTFRGWLPFRTLGLPDLRDGSGERLWYGLADGFRENTNPINSDTNATLTLNALNEHIAVILAPGRPVDGQGPRFTNDFTGLGNSAQVAHYLEQDNAQNPVTAFISSDPNPADDEPFNDIALGITPRELLPAVERTVAGELRLRLSNILDGTCGTVNLPNAAVFGGDSTDAVTSPPAATALTRGAVPGNVWINDQFVSGIADAAWNNNCRLANWFFANKWNTMVYYEFCPTPPSPTPPSPTPPNCLETCVGVTDCPVNTGDARNVVIIMAGREQAGQNREADKTDLSEFFENENNDKDAQFVDVNPNADPANHNDILLHLPNP